MKKIDSIFQHTAVICTITLFLSFTQQANSSYSQEALRQWHSEFTAIYQSNPTSAQAVIKFLYNALKWVSPADGTHNAGFVCYFDKSWENQSEDVRAPGASFWSVITRYILPGFENTDTQNLIVKLADILVPETCYADFSDKQARRLCTPGSHIPLHIINDGSFKKGFTLFHRICRWGMMAKNFQAGGFNAETEQQQVLVWLQSLHSQSRCPELAELKAKALILHTAFEKQQEVSDSQIKPEQDSA